MILDCYCYHAYQDAVYGKGRRVHNLKKNGGWVCSVCRTEHRGPTTRATEPAKKGKRQ